MGISTPWLFTSYRRSPIRHSSGGLTAGFRALEKVRWVVAEKIHGANFCFVHGWGAVRCCQPAAVPRAR